MGLMAVNTRTPDCKLCCCVHVSVGITDARKRFCVYWETAGLTGCSRSAATAGSPPFLVRFTARTGSQLAFFSPALMSMADPGQTPWGLECEQDWGREAKRGREEDGDRMRERENEGMSRMRSVIHRHPGGHTLEWDNTAHLLTTLANYSLGLPRLQGTRKSGIIYVVRCSPKGD